MSVNSAETKVIELIPSSVIEMKLIPCTSSVAKVTIKNNSQAPKHAIKVKSNAGKHITVKPSVFTVSGEEEKELEILIKAPNVDALISIAQKTKTYEDCYKLQFNYIEITPLFYDKTRNVSEGDFIDLINKRVLSIPIFQYSGVLLKQIKLYPFRYASSHFFTIHPNRSSNDSNESCSKETPCSTAVPDETILTLEETVKKLTIAQSKSKESYDHLQKKYLALKEQMEIMKKDTHIPQAPEPVLPSHEEKEVVSLYTGISLFHLLAMSCSFVCLLDTHTMEDDGFVIVTGKKNKKLPKWSNGKLQLTEKQMKSVTKAINVFAPTHSVDDEKIIVQKTIQTIDSYCDKMEEYPFFTTMVSILQQRSPFTKIVCFGIGCIHDSSISQFQFACVLSIYKKLQIQSPLEVFDPVMDMMDAKIVDQFNVTILYENELGKRKINEPTLFFMPHCGFSLYNGVIWSNWGVSLQFVTIIGNQFSGYDRFMLNEEKRKDPSNCILPLLDYITELPLFAELPKVSACLNRLVYDSFHSMAILYLSNASYRKGEEVGLWLTHPPEPVFEGDISNEVNQELVVYLKHREDYQCDQGMKGDSNDVQDNLSQESQQDVIQQSHHDLSQITQEDVSQESHQELSQITQEDVSQQSLSEDDWIWNHLTDASACDFNSLIPSHTILPLNTKYPNTQTTPSPPRTVYIYKDSGCSYESVNMAQFTLSKLLPGYSVQTFTAEDIVSTEWEKDCCLIVFPGGAAKPYHTKLSTMGGNQRILQYIKQGGRYLGFCAGAYYACSSICFQQTETRYELQLFQGEGRGPAMKGFDAHSSVGTYSAQFSYEYKGTVMHGTSFFKGGPYFVPNPETDFVCLARYDKQDGLMCDENAIGCVECAVGVGKCILCAFHLEYDPWLLKKGQGIDDIIDALREQEAK